MSQRLLVSSSSSSSLKNATTTSKMLLLLATIFFQKMRLFSKTWTPTKTPTYVYYVFVVRAFSFQFSIFLSRSIILDSVKKKRKRNPVSLRVSVVGVVRVFFARREESRRHRYTRVFQNRAVSARIIIEGREASFATKPLFSEQYARLFYAYFCSHYSNAREREKRPFSSSNLLIKKVYTRIEGREESFATKPLFSERLFYAYFCSHYSNARARERRDLFLLRISS